MSTYPGERCQHIKMSGDRCRASALRDQRFCRFHNCCGPVQVDVSPSAAEPAAPFFLPVLEDATSIQATITQICEHLLHRRLDAKKAGVLLYAMQVASSNLARLSEDRSQEKTKENTLQPSSPVPASSEATPISQDDSGSISSLESDRLPPGTIQACEQPRRFVV